MMSDDLWPDGGSPREREREREIWQRWSAGWGAVFALLAAESRADDDGGET
jgi:hypothetical protein